MISSSHFLSLRRTRRAGFSLAEVILALGVVSIALLSLMALLPVVLTTLRELHRTTAHANILQYVSSQAHATPYSQLSTLTVGPVRFDDQGLRIADASAPWVYSASMALASVPALPGGFVPVSDSAKMVRVTIEDIDAPGKPTLFSLIISNQGK